MQLFAPGRYRSAACAMADSSVAGLLVPSVPEPAESAPFGDTSTVAAATTAVLALPEEARMRAAWASPQGPAEEEGPRRLDLLYSIYMALIKDAFLTAWGHNFCYMCIVKHLSNKSDCPCCGHYLTKAQLYPNFLLDKVCIPLCSKLVCDMLKAWERLDMEMATFSDSCD